MTTARAERPTTRLQEFLRLDHARLHQSFDQLLGAFRSDDAESLRDAWSRFEAGLYGHLEAEERFLIPLFRAAHPREAEALLTQHAVFRRALADLGVGIDLKLVKLDMAEDLVAALRAHADREEHLLYDWADRELGPAAHDRVAEVVRAAEASAPRLEA